MVQQLAQIMHTTHLEDVFPAFLLSKYTNHTYDTKQSLTAS